MTRLTVLPAQAVIDGLKRTVDFYVYMGIPVARSWPRSPGKKRSPQVEAQWPAFSYATQEWSRLSPEVQAAYNAMAERSGLSGRDLQIRAYLSGLYRYPLE